MARPFPQDIEWLLQPSGPFVSFEVGALEGRIYQNTGYIEVAGPDLAAHPKKHGSRPDRRGDHPFRRLHERLSG